jgi:hypothetical protein
MKWKKRAPFDPEIFYLAEAQKLSREFLSINKQEDRKK